MKNPKNLTKLAKDFAVLVQKHGLKSTRFYPTSTENDHLLFDEGRVQHYREKTTWTSLIK